MFDREFLTESLELQVKAVPLLRQYSRHNIYFKTWWDKTKDLLEQLHGPESKTVKKFCDIRFGHRKLNIEGKAYTQKAREAYLAGLQKAQKLLLESVNTNLSEENCCVIKKPGSAFKLQATPEELKISVLLNLQELRTHLVENGLSQEEQEIICKELENFMQLLNPKKINNEKIRLSRIRLETLFNQKAYKTETLLILYHLSVLMDRLTCIEDM